MRLFLFYLGSLCTLLPLIGCADPAAHQPDRPAKERLTIQDLRPADTHLLQPQIFLNWVEFEINAEVAQNITETLNLFSSKPVQFQKASLYAQNGISVFFGSSGQGPALIEAVNKLNAKSIKRAMLMIPSKMPEFYPVTSPMGDSVIDYTTPADQTTQRTYPPGQFGFMLTASLTAKRGTIDIECKPAFVPAIGLPYYHDNTANAYGATYLPLGEFKATLVEGNFLVLAPNRNSTQTTLDNTLFRLIGPKARTRIYVILFTRVDY